MYTNDSLIAKRIPESGPIRQYPLDSSSPRSRPTFVVDSAGEIAKLQTAKGLLSTGFASLERCKCDVEIRSEFHVLARITVQNQGYALPHCGVTGKQPGGMDTEHTRRLNNHGE